MTMWQVFAALIVVVAVAVIAFLIGRASGRSVVEQGAGVTDDATGGNVSLFGADVPVKSTERQLVAVMPEALIVVDSLAAVKYASPDVQRFDLIEDDAMTVAEIRDILRLVSTDSVVRERELAIPLDRSARTAANNTGGRGIEAGTSLPADTLYLHVRIGQIADDRFAIFLSDMSEQHRFEIMRRDFVTNVSHELKTPAGAISLLAETIESAADDPDAVRYFAGRISKESTRLTELVHRLIDLQKAQNTTAMLNAQRLSVLQVAREAINENQVNADSKHISLALSVNGTAVPVSDVASDGAAPTHGEDDVFIKADYETIKTAVKNLVENAVNYSPEYTTVAIGVSGDGAAATIRVVDQGIGIPAASLDRIFERFYRVDPARSRETGGTGLGLAITKHCVRDCGGTINVWSREGEGSTFTITLPQVSGDEPEEARTTKDFEETQEKNHTENTEGKR
jgi:two-component system, OmpR family, sensor histidine kinase SenX3